MSEQPSMTEIRAATYAAFSDCETVYGYYLIRRPPAPGAQPSDALSVVSLAYRTWHEGICDDIWGWVCYARPLTYAEVTDYELLPDEDNPCRYQQYGLAKLEYEDRDDGTIGHKRTMIRDMDGNLVATSYPRKALAMLDKLSRKPEYIDARTVVKLVKFTIKDAADAAPPVGGAKGERSEFWKDS